MPYALILIGAILLIAGIRNQHVQLWHLVENDFTEGNFLSWVAAIAVIGGLGYIPKLKPLSIAFMTLLLIVLVISNGGVFAKLQQFVQSGAGSGSIAPSPQAPQPSQPAANTNSSAPSAVDQIMSNLGNIQ